MLVMAVAALACNRKADSQSVQGMEVHPTTCGQAQTEAIRLAGRRNYEAALDMHGLGLSLCQKSRHGFAGELRGIADIARLAPQLCRKAVVLFHSVPEMEEVSYLRSSAGLQMFCAKESQGSSQLARLVEMQAKQLGYSDSPALRDAIREYEAARLYHWVPNPTEHLRHLRAGTAELCREGALSLAMRSFESDDANETNPIGGLLGLWTIQPSHSFDKATISCLTTVAVTIRQNSHRFSARNQKELEEWLAWWQRQRNLISSKTD